MAGPARSYTCGPFRLVRGSVVPSAIVVLSSGLLPRPRCSSPSSLVPHPAAAQAATAASAAVRSSVTGRSGRGAAGRAASDLRAELARRLDQRHRPAHLHEIRRLPTGKEPHHLYLTPDEKSLIVANALADSLTFIDPVTAEIQRTIVGIVDPYHLRFSPDMKWFVTAVNRLDRIDIYRWLPADAAQPLKLAARVPAAQDAQPPEDRQQEHDGLRLAAGQRRADRHRPGDADAALEDPGRQDAGRRLPARPTTGPLLVGLTGDECVEVYDVSGPAPRLVKRIRTGAGAHAFRARGDGRHVFVSNRVANTHQPDRPADARGRRHLPGARRARLHGRARPTARRCSSPRAGRASSPSSTPRRRQVVRQVAVGRSPHGVWTLDHAPRR